MTMLVLRSLTSTKEIQIELQAPGLATSSGSLLAHAGIKGVSWLIGGTSKICLFCSKDTNSSKCISHLIYDNNLTYREPGKYM